MRRLWTHLQTALGAIRRSAGLRSSALLTAAVVSLSLALPALPVLAAPSLDAYFTSSSVSVESGASGTAYIHIEAPGVSFLQVDIHSPYAVSVSANGQSVPASTVILGASIPFQDGSADIEISFTEGGKGSDSISFSAEGGDLDGNTVSASDSITVSVEAPTPSPAESDTEPEPEGEATTQPTDPEVEEATTQANSQSFSESLSASAKEKKLTFSFKLNAEKNQLMDVLGLADMEAPTGYEKAGLVYQNKELQAFVREASLPLLYLSGAGQSPALYLFDAASASVFPYYETIEANAVLAERVLKDMPETTADASGERIEEAAEASASDAGAEAVSPAPDTEPAAAQYEDKILREVRAAFLPMDQKSPLKDFHLKLAQISGRAMTMYSGSIGTEAFNIVKASVDGAEARLYLFREKDGKNFLYELDETIARLSAKPETGRELSASPTVPAVKAASKPDASAVPLVWTIVVVLLLVGLLGAGVFVIYRRRRDGGLYEGSREEDANLLHTGAARAEDATPGMEVPHVSGIAPDGAASSGDGAPPYETDATLAGMMGEGRTVALQDLKPNNFDKVDDYFSTRPESPVGARAAGMGVRPFTPPTELERQEDKLAREGIRRPEPKSEE